MNTKIRRALVEKLTVPVPLAGQALGLGRSAAYAGVRNGQIPSFKVGAKHVVPTAPLRKMLGIDVEPKPDAAIADGKAKAAS